MPVAWATESRCYDRAMINLRYRATCRPLGHAGSRILALLSIALPLLATAAMPAPERLEHRRWLSSDGGPGQVGAIAHSADGYLWLGTNDSLFRFDGQRFLRYAPPDGDALGIVASLLIAKRLTPGEPTGQ